MLQPTELMIESLGPCRYENPISTINRFKFRDDSERLLLEPYLNAYQNHAHSEPASFEIAGPRKRVFFNAAKTRVAIVTCGGICPGLNAVIRGLVMELWYLYGCTDIQGIRYGYQGLKPDAQAPIQLTPEMVDNIHTMGGTFLGSSRGSPSKAVMVDELEKRGIDILFVIGGDGTMRGGNQLWAEIKRRQRDIAIVGIPKTVDNDIPLVHRSFGFESAVEQSAEVINAAEVEARGALNGVGLVKLMGRDTGYIAAHASLASGHVNFCLIPEAGFSIDGESGLFELLKTRLEKRQHAVIVVAEGAGQNLLPEHAIEYDASGNPKLGDIGLHLKQRLIERFTDEGIPITIKYFEPSYLVRSAPPNSSDKQYCDQLARGAVHAAMAGKTGMLVGNWHGRITHVPLATLVSQERSINVEGELWYMVQEHTGQPHIIGSPSCPVSFPKTEREP